MGWPMVRLDSLYNIARGGSPRPIKDFITDDSEGINWIKIGDATASGKYIYTTKQKIKPEGIQRSRLVKEGDFLLSNSMSFGRPYIMGTTGCIHDGWLVLSAKDKQVDQDFLYHLLGSPFVFSQFDSLAAGSTVRNLNIDLVSGVKIPLIPIPEQQRIVAILDQAFADIEKARANAEQNLKNARELFDSYLNQVFSQRGEGWVERPLSEIADVKYGFTDKATEEGDFRYVRITDIDKNGELVSTDKKYIQSSTEARKFTLCEKDLLMARTGATFAKVLLYRDYEPSIFASYLIKISFKEDIDNEFYWFFSKTSLYWNQANELKSGAAQPHFNGTALKQVRLPYPLSRDEQTILIEKFKAILSETMKLENFYEKKLVSLDELKKSLLQKAFSGELTKTEGQAA